MKTPTVLSVNSSQREQTSLRFQVPRLPRSNVCSTRDLENPSASVHLKRFSTPSLTLKFLCAGKLNPRPFKTRLRHSVRERCESGKMRDKKLLRRHHFKSAFLEDRDRRASYTHGDGSDAVAL